MSTPVEIKKIAREYAMQVYPKEPYEDIGQMEFLRDTFVRNATKFISLLSKDYCIVPKSKLKEIYDCYKQHGQVTDKKGLHDAMLIARGSIATMHDIFGKELFNEEKE